MADPVRAPQPSPRDRSRDRRGTPPLRAQRSALRVGPADDPLEREADAVADAAMAALVDSGEAQLSLQAPSPTRIRRAATAVDAAGGALDAADDRAVRSALGGGSALPDATRAPLEQAFGADFGAVRVHTGSQTDALAQRLSAQAFTVGSDIFVRSQDYQPGTTDATRLLAHELTHTLQQGGTRIRRSTLAP